MIIVLLMMNNLKKIKMNYFKLRKGFFDYKKKIKKIFGFVWISNSNCGIYNFKNNIFCCK